MQQKVSKYVVKQLAQWGVKRIYGVAGDANLSLMDEIGKQSSIQYVPCRHETAAALMASAEAKLTGLPAVCIATSGPGTVQLLNGLADAHLDRVPVIAITGQVETYKLGGYHKQYIDQQKLVSGVSVRSELLANPQAIGEALHRAFLTATERMNVAHLAVCKDIWDQETDAALLGQLPRKAMIQADRASVMAACERLLHAKKPLFLLGAGARKSALDIKQLAESTGAGIILTLGAKGTIESKHPHVLGGLGDGGSTATLEALAKADLLVIFGSAWFPKAYLPRHLPMIQIDERLESFHAYEQLTPVLARVEEAIAMWQRRFEGSRPQAKEWKQQVAGLHERYIQEMKEWAEPDETEGIRTEILMEKLAVVVKPDAIVAVDTGEHTIWFNRMFQAESQTPLFSGKWRTMGFGLPASIAAKLTMPDRQVVAIVGDGCLHMTLGELTTLAEQKLAVTLIVVNNRTLGLEEQKMKASGYDPFGTSITSPDYMKLAEAFGIKAYLATAVRQLEGVLKEAVAEGRPTLIDVRCTAPTFTKKAPEIFFQTQALPSYNKNQE